MSKEKIIRAKRKTMKYALCQYATMEYGQPQTSTNDKQAQCFQLRHNIIRIIASWTKSCGREKHVYFLILISNVEK